MRIVLQSKPGKQGLHARPYAGFVPAVDSEGVSQFIPDPLGYELMLRVLEDQTRVADALFRSEDADVSTKKGDGPLLGLLQPQQQVGQRGLPRAVGPYQGHEIPLGKGKTHIAQDGLPLSIAKGHVANRNGRRMVVQFGEALGEVHPKASPGVQVFGKPEPGAQGFFQMGFQRGPRRTLGQHAAPRVQEHHPVHQGQAGVHLVLDEQHGVTSFKAGQGLEELPGARRVQIGRWFIQDEDGLLHGQQCGQGYSLGLASR